jgi:hypothetical protein
VFALSWLALAIAVVSLVLGFSRNGLALVYVSMGASLVAVVFLLAGVIRRPSDRDAAGPPTPRSPAGRVRPS